MICSTFLEEVAVRLRDLEQRSERVSRGLSEEQLNWRPSADLWSIGQIYGHLNIANKAYFPAMEHAIEFGKFGKEVEVKHTLAGSMIIKFAGPGLNAPVPGSMTPPEGKSTLEVATQFEKDMDRTIELAKRAEDMDLNKSKLKNPILPLLTLNLSDGFEIMTCHGERHIGQIELMLRRADFPK
ncbi:hypothetical protein BH11ARM1_BH11ARM1_00790 [soil metagenome]